MFKYLITHIHMIKMNKNRKKTNNSFGLSASLNEEERKEVAKGFYKLIRKHFKDEFTFQDVEDKVLELNENEKFYGRGNPEYGLAQLVKEKKIIEVEHGKYIIKK